MSAEKPLTASASEEAPMSVLTFASWRDFRNAVLAHSRTPLPLPFWIQQGQSSFQFTAADLPCVMAVCLLELEFAEAESWEEWTEIIRRTLGGLNTACQGNQALPVESENNES